MSHVVSVKDSHGIRWQVSAAFAPLFLADRTPDPRRLLRAGRGQLIKKSPARIIFGAALPGGPRPLPVVIKIYRHANPGEWLKANLCGSKARREWRITTAASERGLPTVVPVAFGERRRAGILRESYLVTVRLFNCVTLEEALFSPDGTLRAGAKERRRLIIILAALLRRMHDCGIYHKDLHPGNFLVETLPGGEKRIYLLDLHRAGASTSLPLRHRIRSLSQFNMFASISLSTPERLLFFNSYFAEDALWTQEKRQRLAKIDLLTREMRWQLWRRREQRCLANNKYFMRLSFEGFSGFARRGEWKGEMAELLLARDLQSGGARLLKDSRSKNLWEREVEFHGVKRALFIKHYKPKRGWKAFKYLWRRSQALRSWQGSYAIEIRNIKAVRAVAALEERSPLNLLRHAYLITEKIPGVVNMADAIAGLRPDASGRRTGVAGFMRALALFLRRVHRVGIYHGDMKATNILVGRNRDGSPSFCLTDLDFVRTRLDLSRRQVLRNLLQINKSFLDLGLVSMRDRARFLKFYLGPRRRGELRGIWKTLLRRTRRYMKKTGRKFHHGDKILDA
jgi:tRNA A-37 threonylcarbamoyl transferase component Bud32